MLVASSDARSGTGDGAGGGDGVAAADAGAGDGGLAGFAKGGADVELIDQGDEITLRYRATAETGGKIAQLGARLIESTAKKLSKTFFSNFEKIMLNEK